MENLNKNDTIKNDTIKDELIKDELIKDELIKDELIKDEAESLISNNINKDLDKDNVSTNSSSEPELVKILTSLDREYTFQDPVPGKSCCIIL
jgi:hypothetical protein